MKKTFLARVFTSVLVGAMTLGGVSQSGTASTTFTVAQESAPADPAPSDPSTPTTPSTPTAPTDAPKDAAPAGQQPVADAKKAALPASGDEPRSRASWQLVGFLSLCSSSQRINR